MLSFLWDERKKGKNLKGYWAGREKALYVSVSGIKCWYNPGSVRGHRGEKSMGRRGKRKSCTCR